MLPAAKREEAGVSWWLRKPAESVRKDQSGHSLSLYGYGVPMTSSTDCNPGKILKRQYLTMICRGRA